MRYSQKNRLLGGLLALLLVCMPVSCDTRLGGSASDSTAPPVTGDGQEFVYPLTREDRRTEPQSPTVCDLGSVKKELVITDAGDYRLSGKLEGQIVVRAEEQVVHLFLDGVQVHSSSGPALCVASAGKVVVTLCEGSENTLTDGASYLDDSFDACLYSLNDLTLNGTGRLTVFGYYKDAVHTKDFLKIAGPTLSLRANDDALHANDGMVITGAKIAAEAESCGLRTTKKGKPRKGHIEITDADLSVIAGKYAITSSGNLRIASSTAFLKGIQSDCTAEGTIDIEEGNLRHE